MTAALSGSRVRFVAYSDDVGSSFERGDVLVCLESAAGAGVGDDAIRAVRVVDGRTDVVFPEELELIRGALTTRDRKSLGRKHRTRRVSDDVSPNVGPAREEVLV